MEAQQIALPGAGVIPPQEGQEPDVENHQPDDEREVDDQELPHRGGLGNEEHVRERRYPQRIRRPPAWTESFDLGDPEDLE